eukprot:scaffold3767_cov242-Prasinococcus_capsulatus_cf.AAC.8
MVGTRAGQVKACVDHVADSARATAADLRVVLDAMAEEMSALGLSWRDALYVQLCLADMVRPSACAPWPRALL